MTRFLTLETIGLSRGSSRHQRVTDADGKAVPDYEKPLVKTGEGRLWRALNSGDRVKVIHNGNYRRTGVIHERTQDGSTVWIFPDHGLGRISVTEGDPASLFLIE